VPAASPLLAQHFAHAQPTVVTHNAAHALHNTVAVPHLNSAFHQNVAPTATFLRNADGTISQVANFNQFQGLQTVPLNSGFLRAFPNQHFAGQHLIQHAY